ncbi:MAG: N-methylhydantoinase [Blastocatellia bacterium]|jgi:N-methylhydantoinase A|nr:N-methylhydantoinase [Blastocatellia bacterium]
MVKKKSNDLQTVKSRVGVDTGGTFTDFVFVADGKLRVFKLASTPHDPAAAIIAGLKRIEVETGTERSALEVVHGTTVGTNALLQRRGARTALVTTAGFEDVLVIGRQARPELYNLNAEKPPPLVPDGLRFGVNERVAANGEVIETLDEENIAALLAKLRKARVESVAICLLFSFAYPEHERRIAAALTSLKIPLSISHQILPEYREYERTSTVAINAYLQPLMGAYLSRLDARVRRLRVMQSSGGSISAARAASEPVRTILSGPAGGIVGATRATAVSGFENIVTFDMGGTSTDVALCGNGGLSLTNEALVAGMPVAVPMMDIHTVGAGGGSIARVDEGGSLRVGPESAGADPGPACYGKSDLPTVTDAHVVLGHLPDAALLSGEFKLDQGRARTALDRLAGKMSVAAQRRLTGMEAAQGIIDVVNVNMERALRHVSVERGHDPRGFALVPFGGAGGLHAVELARGLRIPRVILPAHPGALSAIGIVAANVVQEQSRTVMLEVNSGTARTLERVFREMQRTARATLKREGFPETFQRHEQRLAMRYKGQSFELEVENGAGDLAAAFHQAHLQRYDYAQEDNSVEIVSARLRSLGLVTELKIERARSARRENLPPPETAMSYFAGKPQRTGIYQRENLPPGATLRAPCIVAEYSATTLIPAGTRARVDQFGNLIIDV